MKYLIAICLVLTVYVKGMSLEDISYYKATTEGAIASERIRVIDQDGIPVQGAKVRAGLQVNGEPNGVIAIDGYTDAKGEFSATGKTIDIFAWRIAKDGYYTTFAPFHYSSTTVNPKVVNGKWQPYGALRTLKINKMLNPQRLLYHNAAERFDFPAYGVWIGFDCEKYDYVMPYGKGIENDILLRYSLLKPGSRDHSVVMQVSFTNSLYSGAYEMKKLKLSEFKSSYHADTNAIYKQSFRYSYESGNREGSYEYKSHLSEDDYLVFRVRTKVDDEGRLISAHYGKIYGPWNIHNPNEMSIEEFFFNPNPNNTNLEDDRTANISRHSTKKIKR